MKHSPMKKSALHISLSALCAALVCLCSWISIPLGGVPMTLQVFGVAFCGFLLGARGGASAVAVYLALGAVGLPVFAGFGGSLAFLVGPTGGFLVGFLPLAIFCGMTPARLTAKKKTALGAVLFPLFGLVLCHIPGVLWFAHVSGVSPAQAFLVASLPYLPKDVISVLFARAAARRVMKTKRNLCNPYI